MEIQIVQQPDLSLCQYFENKIEEFNQVHWEVKKKIPLVVKVEDSQGNILAGVAAKTFGNWLLIENLWVNEELRGQDIGSRILESLEGAAKARGCRYALLDTLSFQARPFYEKYGYKVEWTQSFYPKTGCKYFMTKDLA